MANEGIEPMDKATDFIWIKQSTREVMQRDGIGVLTGGRQICRSFEFVENHGRR